MLEVFFFYISEFRSPVATRDPVVTSVQVDDSVVPVNFVPISPIAFVYAVSASSISSNERLIFGYFSHYFILCYLNSCCSYHFLIKAIATYYD